MSEILDNQLFLGNYRDSLNEQFLIARDINVIVNCTKDLPFSSYQGIKRRYRIPVDDDLREESIQEMAYALEFIIPLLVRHIQNGDRVLIHCFAGMQRSAVVTLALLYELACAAKSNPIDLYNYIRSRRPIAFQPSFNFERAFISYYNRHNIDCISTN